MKKKLLIVDDDARVRVVLVTSFRMRGYEVVPAADGEEAEQLALTERPDLVILDVMMPKKNGFAVCRDLKCDPRFGQVPVILLTAKDREADVYWGLDCGADAYVTKPYDPRQLEELVVELLQEAADGKRKIAWTGLPAGWRLEEEFELRRAGGGDPLLVELTLPFREAEVFRQKYGQAKFRGVVHRTGWRLHEVLKDSCPSAALGQRPDDTFVLVLPKGEEKRVMREVLRATEPLLHSFYDDEDRALGAVLATDPMTSQTVEVGLLRLCWRDATERA